MPQKKSTSTKKKAKNKEFAKRSERAQAALLKWRHTCLDATAELLPCCARAPEDVASPQVSVELHSHSHYSDGVLSPRELVERAAMRGVKILALTDHDTCAGVEEAQLAGLEKGVAIIPGVEISAFLTPGDVELAPHSTGLHILGYFPPRVQSAATQVSSGGGGCDSTEAGWSILGEAMAGVQRGRIHRIHTIVSKLQRRGIDVTADAVLEAMGKSVSASRNHVAQVLLKRGLAESYRDAFSRLLADDAAFLGNGAEIEAGHAIRLIQGAGGVAVLAHPWSVKSVSARRLLLELHDRGLGGVEVCRGERKMQEYEALAKELDLLCLGGSDFHARGEGGETDLGSCPVSLSEVHKLLSLLTRAQSQV